jgi:hypothetical protein
MRLSYFYSSILRNRIDARGNDSDSGVGVLCVLASTSITLCFDFMFMIKSDDLIRKIYLSCYHQLMCSSSRGLEIVGLHSGQIALVMFDS